MGVYHNQFLFIVLITFVLQVIACQQKPNKHKISESARIEHIEGSALRRVILTQRAIERLNITTAEVYEELISHSQNKLRMVVPYSAVIYDKHGSTWVYTNPETRVYIRHKINIINIEGDKAFVSEGPLAGTNVVKIGAAELYGTEFGVGH